jgi:hypothetical protein
MPWLPETIGARFESLLVYSFCPFLHYFANLKHVKKILYVSLNFFISILFVSLNKVCHV